MHVQKSSTCFLLYQLSLSLITKILPFILMRKAGADAAIKKGFEKVAKLRKKKDKLKADVARTSISDVTRKLLDKWKRSK